jgi:FixJ family two-component response regulator
MTTSPLVRIVDDDSSFRNAVSRLLRASGFAVQAFSSAEEFMAGLASDVPGCALVDLQMPGLNGLELQETLAKAGVRLPIVLP